MKKQLVLSAAVVKISSYGIKKLPSNFVIQQLIEVNNSTDVGRGQEANRIILCEKLLTRAMQKQEEIKQM